MKVRSSPRHAAIAVAAMLFALTSQQEVDAFAPVRTNTKYNSPVKGRECGILCATTAAPEATDAVVAVAKETKSKKTSKSTRKKKQKSVKKGQKRVDAKNSPKRNKGKSKSKSKSKGKGKTSLDTKSFKPLKDLKLGSKISGTVVDVCDFGAFINIGYATQGHYATRGRALLHISQIQDKKISNIRDIIKVGDTIEGARVVNVDLKKGEVGLSLRDRRPKRRDFSKFEVGDDLEGKVDSVVPYGVFVDVGASVNALLHISRITGGAIENVRQFLNEGDPVTVHIVDLDKGKKTMAVSMLDKKADQYLDRRMSQRLKRYYGATDSSKKGGASKSKTGAKKEDESSDLDYFDQAIRELEDALSDRVVEE